MIERNVERQFLGYMRQCDLITLKLTLRGSTGWPDRLVLLPGGRVCWVELKRPGGKARALQNVRIQTLKDLGHDAEVFDDALRAAYFVAHCWRRAMRLWKKGSCEELVRKMLPEGSGKEATLAAMRVRLRGKNAGA